PGFLTSHLDDAGGAAQRAWLAPAVFQRGGLDAALALDDTRRLMATGPLQVLYRAAATAWRRAGVVVHELGFDWRQRLGPAPRRPAPPRDRAHRRPPAARAGPPRQRRAGRMPLRPAPPRLADAGAARGVHRAAPARHLRRRGRRARPASPAGQARSARGRVAR